MFYKLLHMATVLVGVLACSVSAVHAQRSNSFEWAKIDEHTHFIRNARYQLEDGDRINYTVVRFHLGYSRLKLLDSRLTVESGKDVKDGVARVTVGGTPGAELLNYGLQGIWARLDRKPLVMAPAGWSRSQRFVEHIGLLRIDGRQIHRISDRASMTAILCLNDQQRYRRYEAMIPVAFNSSDADHLNSRARQCRDAVQVGPRIIEEGAKPGITKGESDNPKSQRVVFLVDDPRRMVQQPRSRDAARNGYLLITHNPVNLYDLQSMLLDPAFYDGGAPHWAVNLAGANLSGMILNIDQKPVRIDSTLAVVGSAILVEKLSVRPDGDELR